MEQSARWILTRIANPGDCSVAGRLPGVLGRPLLRRNCQQRIHRAEMPAASTEAVDQRQHRLLGDNKPESSHTVINLSKRAPAGRKGDFQIAGSRAA